MIAQIIVDVPVNRTNRPFDYHVPPWLRPLIRIGSRVVVPFGPRQLQGYVIGIVEDDQAIPDRSRLKDVVQVQDDTPPLTPELLKMSEWMSKQYLCPWVTAVQAMLPAVLKGKSEKWLTATDALDEEACGRSGLLWELFRKRQLPLTEVEKQFGEEYLLVPGWIQSGLLATEYQVRDKITRKQQSFVRSLLDEGSWKKRLVRCQHGQSRCAVSFN